MQEQMFLGLGLKVVRERETHVGYVHGSTHCSWVPVMAKVNMKSCHTSGLRSNEDTTFKTPLGLYHLCYKGLVVRLFHSSSLLFFWSLWKKRTHTASQM
jgi:hypothetical protein